MDQTGFASAVVHRDQEQPPLAVQFRLPKYGATLDDRVRTRISSSKTIDEVALCLLHLLTGGFGVWEDGRLIETRVFVDSVGPLRIVIHTREHGPPHFHVLATGIDASFAIRDCSKLRGSITPTQLKLVQYWHAQARPLLIKVWNQSRPSDCPVGPIEEE